MTERLFLGGPYDRRWVNVDERYLSHVVPLPRKVAFWSSSEGTVFDDRETVTYRRRRAVIPGWRVPLTFFVAEGFDPFTHTGFVLPGYVVGTDGLQPMSRVCRSCHCRPVHGSAAPECLRCWLLGGRE